MALFWSLQSARTNICTCMEASWWRHQMETFSALLAICAGNSPVPGEFPSQRPATRSFDVFFDLRLNRMLRKQPWGWWFETLSSPLWLIVMIWIIRIYQPAPSHIACGGVPVISKDSLYFRRRSHGLVRGASAVSCYAERYDWCVGYFWRAKGKLRMRVDYMWDMKYPLIIMQSWFFKNNFLIHCSDVIMGAMAFQFTDFLFNHLSRRRSNETSKLRVTILCEGNPAVTGGDSPHKRTEMFPFNDLNIYGHGRDFIVCSNHMCWYIIAHIWLLSVLVLVKYANEADFPDNKIHGPNMGPIWGRQDPGGPHVGPMNLAIWV